MRHLLSALLAWWAFLHISWMVLTFLLWGVLVIPDENPLAGISEWVYDVYAFGLFRMQGWVILGFAPFCWFINFFTMGSPRIIPWKPLEKRSVETGS